jgi:glucosylceramidase
MAWPLVLGMGWYCCAGQVQAQSVIYDAHPDNDTWFTECSGWRWAAGMSEGLPWTVCNVVIGAARHWARGVLPWNLTLDENHDPHLGGCKDCHDVVTIDSRSGAVKRNLEYDALPRASVVTLVWRS